MKGKNRWMALIGGVLAAAAVVLAGCQNPSSEPGEVSRETEQTVAPDASVRGDQNGGGTATASSTAVPPAAGGIPEPAAEGEGEDAVVYRYESVTEMRAGLSALPENTPETPYLVKLGSGVRLDDADMWGTVTVYGKTYDDPLMGLFSAPSGRYAALDLTEISDAVREIPKGENHRSLDGYVEPNDYVVSLTLPAWVTKIGNDAFHKLTKLEYVNLEDTGITEIGRDAFAVTGLRSVALPETLTALGERAFSKSKQLSSVDMGRLAITEIPDRCFYGCTALREIVWPPQLETIGHGTFVGAGFVTLTIPPTVKTIGGGAFVDNDQLVWFKWPEAPAKATGMMWMLSNCENLVRIQYPPTMGGVLSSVDFYNCPSLETVILPWKASRDYEVVTLVDREKSFDGASDKIRIYVPDGNVHFYRNRWINPVIEASPEIITPLSALTDVPENWTAP
jgi:hypothetical protein